MENEAGQVSPMDALVNALETEITDEDVAQDDDVIEGDAGEAGEPDGDENDEAEGEDEGEDDEAPVGRYKVKDADGNETAVTFDELRAGYEKVTELNVALSKADERVSAARQE